MASTAVMFREKNAKSVIDSARTNLNKINKGLRKLLLPYIPDGENLLNFEHQILAQIRLLEEKRDKMVSADDLNMVENKEDRAARGVRNEKILALYKALVALRKAIDGLYGGPAAEMLRFSGKTPKEPVALNRFANEVIIALKSSSLPEPKVEGTSIDINFWIGKLETLKEQLNIKVEDVGREQRESEQTMIAKNQAVEDFDEYFSRVSNALIGLYRLAGEEELADRVRLSSRKTGRTAPDEDSEPIEPKDS